MQSVRELRPANLPQEISSLLGHSEISPTCRDVVDEARSSSNITKVKGVTATEIVKQEEVAKSTAAAELLLSLSQPQGNWAHPQNHSSAPRYPTYEGSRPAVQGKSTRPSDARIMHAYTPSCILTIALT